jgi:glycosyltransferase involved in cell wall biosynthesis
MKVAIVHDWIIDIGGAERCLESIYSLYPLSDVYTLIASEQSAVSLGIDTKRITSSFIKKLPKAKRKYRNYLPFFPFAIEQFDLSGYDVVISSSHSVAKGALTDSNQLHICYCHTPVRYAWDMYHQYMKDNGLTKGLKGNIAKLILHYIRIWDLASTNRIDHFIANSQNTAKRIKKIYGRESTVIYPPVDIDRFELHFEKEDFYLTASRMVPYKKMDLIVEAFSQMPDKKLVVVGDGPDFKKIRSKASRNVEILGYQPSDILKELMQKSKAFVFAAEEDFGIVPVEAQACGTPVIGYEKGGLKETVIENKTGIFYKQQTVQSLIGAIAEFERKQYRFDSMVIRKNAKRFGRERFEEEFKNFVERQLTSRQRLSGIDWISPETVSSFKGRYA